MSFISQTMADLKFQTQLKLNSFLHTYFINMKLYVYILLYVVK